MKQKMKQEQLDLIQIEQDLITNLLEHTPK